MLVEGERLKQLVGGATGEVVLCAPFIKTHALRIVLGTIPQDVPLRIYTRWRVDEIAAGVSDLEVYDLVAERAAARLFLLDDLHAKLYIAGDRCLVGSANLTGAALGWSTNPNVELLVEVSTNEPQVASLVARLANSYEATRELRDQITADVAKVERPNLEEVPVAAEKLASASYPWLPRCASPSSLFTVYRTPQTAFVVAGTRDDAVDDLVDLDPPDGLDEAAFKKAIEQRLEQFPGFQSVLGRVPGKLSDADAIEVIKTLRPDYTSADLAKQWQIVRDWIQFFFSERFEVAPESFVVRLRNR